MRGGYSPTLPRDMAEVALVKLGQGILRRKNLKNLRKSREFN